MIWLTWRQLRLQTAALCVAVAGVAVLLAVTGPRLVQHYRNSADIFDHLTRTDRDIYYAGIVVMALAPAIIGAFWGAPLVARELEAGTHQLVWNQSVTRTRWLATKLGASVLGAAAAIGVLSWGVTWWSGPVDGAVSSTRGNLPSRLTPIAFAMRGLVPVGYAVFAVVLGVALGLVIRRTVPAMAITLAVVAFAEIAMPLWVRPHLIPPVREVVTITTARLESVSADSSGRPYHVGLHTDNRADWILSNQTIDAAGNPTTLPAWLTRCLPGPPDPTADRQQASAPDLGACFARLTRQGYRQEVVYQPADRFWALQWAETGVLLAMSGGLAVFCFWWIRRRIV